MRRTIAAPGRQRLFFSGILVGEAALFEELLFCLPFFGQGARSFDVFAMAPPQPFLQKFLPGTFPFHAAVGTRVSQDFRPGTTLEEMHPRSTSAVFLPYPLVKVLPISLGEPAGGGVGRSSGL